LTDGYRKGKEGERDTVRRWRQFGFESQRQPNSGGLMWKGDLYCGELPWLHIEVKYVERLNIEACMDKARSECKSGQTALLIHKRARKPALATLEEAELLGLLRELEDLRNEKAVGETDTREDPRT